MTRGEWGLVAFLLLVSFLCLTMISPADVIQAQERLAALTSAPTEAPPAEPSPTPMPTPRATATPEPSPTATPTQTPPPTPTPFPFDTHPEEPRYIYIDQLAQRIYIFVYGELLRDIPCSTGLPTSTTTTEAWEGRVGSYRGTFTSFGVYADDAWFLYQSLGNILIHSLPYNYEGDTKVYEDRDALGVRPTSHGCIRIAPEDSQWLTEWNPEGALCTVSEPYTEYWQANDRAPGVAP